MQGSPDVPEAMGRLLRCSVYQVEVLDEVLARFAGAEHGRRPEFIDVYEQDESWVDLAIRISSRVSTFVKRSSLKYSTSPSFSVLTTTSTQE